MSLLVWLPLNGNDNNYGLNKVTLTGNGGTATYLDGKIGKCLLVNGRYITISPITLGSEASVCYWSKTTVNNKMVWTSSAFSEKLNIYENNIYTLNTGDSNNNPFQNNGSNINVLHDGLWHHFAVTFGNNESKLYIDGEYRGTAINFRSPAITNGQIKLAGGFNKTHDYDWNGLINDFRVYDHCLSPKEVKEISKGLVLHYTLDDYSRNTLLPPGVELYDYIQSDGTLWIDTKYIPNDTSGIYLRAYCTTSGGNYLAIGCRQTSGNTRWWINYSNYLELSWNLYTRTLTGYTNTWTEVEHNYMNSRSAKVNGTTYSVSYPTLANITYSAYLFNSCNQGNLGTGFIGRISNAKITEGTSIVRNYLPCTYLGEPGMWDTVENKFYKNLGTGQFILGNKITTTYNDNIIYDCSGYLNNGNITGNLTIVSDSPRYTTSVSVDSSEFTTITKQNLSLPDGPTTLSFWSKPEVNTTVDDSKIDITFSKCHYFTYMNYPYFSHDEDYYYKYTNYWSDGNWHLVTCTYDGTIPKMYIDGVLISSNYRTTTVTYSDNLILKLIKNSMSDFRIYATALSDEDIKELYDTSAIIDNLNNLHTRELIEDNMDYVEISKKGIVKTDSLTEGNNGVIFSSDNIECNQLIEI